MSSTNPIHGLPGSDLHYALLYATPKFRDQLALINALKSELCAIPISVSDAGVAHIKLAWWFDELERTSTGKPTHQLTVAYSAKYAHELDILNALNSLIVGLDEEIGGRQILTRDDQIEWFDRTFGPTYRAQVSLMAHPSTDVHQIDNVAKLGCLIEMGYSLLNLRALSRRNLRRLPSDSLLAAGCQWDDVTSGKPAATVEALLFSESEFVLKEIASIHNTFTRPKRRAYLPLFTLSNLVQCTLMEVCEDGCRIWQHRIELTPIRKLWIAWRNRFV
ncbi:MAG: phytoene synthase [Gammaproteobacteria bacterium]|jgi:phytoene synthase